jgi:hypothetical protein
MLVSPTYELGGLELPMYPGDILNTNETPQTVALDAVYTYLGPELASGDIFRTLMTASRADVFPTANQLIDAIRGNINSVSPPSNELYGSQPQRVVNLAWPGNLAPFQPGSTFRRIITATTAFTLPMVAPAAGAGLTLSAAPYDQITVAASSWREFVFQILNSSPTTVIPVNQTNTLLTLTVPATNIDILNNITPGMSAFGTNIAALSKVVGVNRDTGIITLSLAVTATIALNPVTFTPTVVVAGLRSGPK